MLNKTTIRNDVNEFRIIHESIAKAEVHIDAEECAIWILTQKMNQTAQLNPQKLKKLIKIVKEITNLLNNERKKLWN